MSKQQYLKGFQWTKAQSKGCCALFEIFRLTGSYESEDERAKRISQISNDPDLIGVVPENNDQVSVKVPMLADAGWSVPIEWGFAAILDGIADTGNIFYLSDNVDESGDFHEGPFATRAFAKWLMEMDCGEVFEIPGRKSHKGGEHSIKVWVWHPDWKKAKEIIDHTNSLADDYLTEVKDAYKQIAEARRAKNERFLKVFDEAWGGVEAGGRAQGI